MSNSTRKDYWPDPDDTDSQEHHTREAHYSRKQEGSSPPAVWSALQVILDHARRGKVEAEHHLHMLLAGAETGPEVTAFLTSRVEKQDRFAFELLYRRYEPEIYRYITRGVGSSELGEHLTPEVFLRAWQSLSKRTSNREMHLRPYLYKIASNLVIDHCRSEKRRPLLSSKSSIAEEGEQVF